MPGGNPGYKHNFKMGKLIGKTVDWALRQMEIGSFETQKEIALRVVTKAVPANIDFTSRGEKIFSVKELIFAFVNEYQRKTIDSGRDGALEERPSQVFQLPVARDESMAETEGNR